MLKIQTKLTSEKARIPEKAFIADKGVRSTESAGYDLYTIEDNITLKPGERKLFKTGLNIAIPSGYYGRIAPRSGLAYKKGMDVLAGVIDSDYREDVGIILINLSDVDQIVDTTKAIAQLIIEKHYDSEFTIVNELSDTARGGGGFGSTDKRSMSETTTTSNNSSSSSILEQFQKSPGLHPKRRYSEEVRDRNVII